MEWVGVGLFIVAVFGAAYGTRRLIDWLDR